MTVSTMTRALLATAALALFAGCAGGSQVAPSGVAPQSAHQATSNMHPQVAPGRYAAMGGAHLLLAKGTHFDFHVQPPKKCKKNCWALVMASDNYYSNLDIYTDQTGSGYIGTAAGYGGWGAASYGNDECAVGSSSYGILVCNFTASGSTLTLNFTAQLTPSKLSSGYNAYGLAFDSKGNLYGGDWPSNCIDEWNAATIAGYTGSPLAPNATACSTGNNGYFTIVYQFGIDGKTIYVSGDDSAGAVAEGTMKFPSGASKILETPTSGDCGYNYGFPGGVAIGPGHSVLVNSQYGEILSYTKGKGAATGHVCWGFSPNDITDIGIDGYGTNLWGANIYVSTKYVGQVQDFSVPLGTEGTLFTSGITTNELYLGVAHVSGPK